MTWNLLESPEGDLYQHADGSLVTDEGGAPCCCGACPPYVPGQCEARACCPAELCGYIPTVCDCVGAACVYRIDWCTSVAGVVSWEPITPTFPPPFTEPVALQFRSFDRDLIGASGCLPIFRDTPSQAFGVAHQATARQRIGMLASHIASTVPSAHNLTIGPDETPRYLTSQVVFQHIVPEPNAPRFILAVHYGKPATAGFEGDPAFSAFAQTNNGDYDPELSHLRFVGSPTLTTHGDCVIGWSYGLDARLQTRDGISSATLQFGFTISRGIGGCGVPGPGGDSPAPPTACIACGGPLIHISGCKSHCRRCGLTTGGCG